MAAAEGDAATMCVSPEGIMSRKDGGEFPHILPEELSGMRDRELAAEYLALVLDGAKAELSEYLDQVYQRYVAQLQGAALELSEEHKYAQWCDESYYPEIHAFYVRKSFESGVCQHQWDGARFLPLMPVLGMPDSIERGESQRLRDRMREAYVEPFTELFKQRWMGVVTKKQSSNRLSRFELFLQEDYYSIMQEVIDEQESHTAAQAELETWIAGFTKQAWELERANSKYLSEEPSAEFTSHVRAEMEARAQAAMKKEPSIASKLEDTARKQEEDEAEIKKLLGEAWALECQRSKYLPLEPPESFIEANLASVIESLRSGEGEPKPISEWWNSPSGASVSLQKGTGFESLFPLSSRQPFEVVADETNSRSSAASPKVEPECGASGLQLIARKQLLEQMKVPELREIEAVVRQRWEAREDAASVEPPQWFWEETYYPIAFQLYGHATLEARSSGLKREGGAASLAMSPEPHKRQTVFAPQCSPGQAQDIAGTSNFGVLGLLDSLGAASPGRSPRLADAPVEYIAARDVLGYSQLNARFKYEGFVQDYDKEPRMVTLKRKPGDKAADEKPVMNISTFDGTGPVAVTLWGDSVGHFLAVVDEPGHTLKTAVLFENVRIVPVPRNTWNGTLLTSMQLLQSLDALGARPGTRISSAPSLQSPHNGPRMYKAPKYPECISDFRGIRQKLVAPFRGTFRGIVMNMLDVDVTLQGEPKQDFELVDLSGAWMRCCALGRHAEQEVMQNGMEVVIYFATGRGPIGGLEGMLYAMKDAMVIPIQRHLVMPAKSLHLQITCKTE